MIIVEGIDGSGKTTLTEMLLKNRIVDQVLPSPRRAAKGDVERMRYETDRYIRLHGANQRIAVDRFLFSEMAYGPILRGRSAFTRQEYLTKLLELYLCGSFAIFCMPDKLNYKIDENPMVLENEARINNLYNHLCEDSAFCNKKTYVYKWNELDAFKNLTNWIKENR